jgi:hypothetical protein
MPAVNKPMARVFCGARTDVKVRTAECMSYPCTSAIYLTQRANSLSMSIETQKVIPKFRWNLE